VRNNRLAPTDLANLAFRDRSRQRERLLETFEPKIIPYTYNPYRQTVGDAVNLQFDLLGDGLQPTPWAALERAVRAKCKGNSALIAVNLPIAKATHLYATKRNTAASVIDGSPLRLAPGRSHDFWVSLLLSQGDESLIMFPDARRKSHLTELGRLVVFSAQHERFRAANPDYESIALQVWRYANDDSRSVIVYDSKGADLVPYAELIAEITAIYEMLDDLSRMREEELRRKSYSVRGSLL